jgi:hypothetical protein
LESLQKKQAKDFPGFEPQKGPKKPVKFSDNLKELKRKEMIQ